MAKEIKITLYNPKELWKMFWNWVFWPRRKQCSTWIDYMNGTLEYKIVNELLMKKYHENGIIDDTLCNSLELDIRKIIGNVCDDMVKYMSTPIPLDE